MLDYTLYLLFKDVIKILPLKVNLMRPVTPRFCDALAETYDIPKLTDHLQKRHIKFKNLLFSCHSKPCCYKLTFIQQ